MTHSLHRTGSAESLKGDLVLICRSAIGLNNENSGAKIARMLDIIFGVGPSNLGVLETGDLMLRGMDLEAVKAQMNDTSGIRCSFSSTERMREVLRRFKEEDLGISVTVSGIIDDVLALCDDVGLEPHSINLSLGVHGNTELLASEQARKLTTMCGHGLIAASLAEKGIADVACGKMSAREGASMVGLPCSCGLFNLDRAERILAGQSGGEPA